MARPIKETPVLTGNDAKEFERNLEASKHVKISESERRRMNLNFQMMLKIKSETEK